MVNLWNWNVDVYLTFDVAMYGYRSVPDEVTGTPAAANLAADNPASE